MRIAKSAGRLRRANILGSCDSRRAELTDRYFTDEKWALIESLLPGKASDPGCTARDNRLFMEAVLWIARTGRPWRELPPEYGKWFTAYARFRRWTQKGVWTRVFVTLTKSGDCEYALIGASIRRIAPTAHSAAQREGRMEPGRVAA
jgi:transposase